MKKMFFSLTILIFSVSGLSAAPDWVNNYGSSSSYPSSSYLTGFGMTVKDAPDKREQAVSSAINDLSQKIRVNVQSEIVISDHEDRYGSTSDVSSVIKTSSDALISGVEYLFYEDNKNLYSLAYADISELKNCYASEAAVYWDNLVSVFKEAGSLLDRNQEEKALKALYSASKDFTEIYDRWSLFRAVNINNSDYGFFNKLSSAATIDDVKALERDFRRTIDSIEDSETGSLQSGLDRIASIFRIQGIKCNEVIIPDLQYGSTSFSSEFGRYAATRLKAVLTDKLNRGNQNIIFKGQYFEETDMIRFIVFALKEDGSRLAKAEVLIDSTETMGRDIKPQNFSEAMTALREFSNGAVADGGISIDIWTNKGNTEPLVFSEGETLQLYFRVNRPAFLQITYKLASGELVLLENAFYIGSDKTNRTVPLPYEFEVLPPFGVEQLIVTAYSQEPPKAATTPVYIDGELYDVFESVSEVVFNTRGLKRKTDDHGKTAVGEAMLNMTMIKY